VSQITHTLTTCTDFRDGTGQTLNNVFYSDRNGVIRRLNGLNPGVFFYWVKVTAGAGNNSFTITETITTGNFIRLFDIANSSNVFDFNCTTVHPTITQNPTTGDVTAQWNAPTAGTYIMSIKYNANSVVGQPAPTPGTTVHYDFTTTGVPSSTQGLDLALLGPP
jgi:hypothetical protein